MSGKIVVTLALCVALLCAACVPRSEGELGMNPEQKAAVEVAERLHSIEEFQRDVEPAIVAARNELLTADTIVGFRGNDYIDDVDMGGTVLYSITSRVYFMSAPDEDRVRSVFGAYLEPLGFARQEKAHEFEDGTHLTLQWTNAQYGTAISFVVRDDERSSVFYWTDELRSDGSTENPMVFLPLDGREPEWLTPELTEKYRDQ